MNREPFRIDKLIEAAATGTISRRDLVKRAAALGLGAPMIAALLNVSAVGSAAAQTEMTLSLTAADRRRQRQTQRGDHRVLLHRQRRQPVRSQPHGRCRLVTLSADLQGFVGDVAEKWDISGTTATFNLNPKAKWHDGTPLTSKDVAFTLNVLTDPASTSRWGNAFKHIAGYDEAQKATRRPR